MREKLKEFCGHKAQVVWSLHPWSAVCRGAALRGLENSPILSRRSRYHYGFVVTKKFEEGIHDEADAVDNLILGKRARKQMNWVMKKAISASLTIAR